MQQHIKLPTHLANIENPHPVLLVGDHHGFASHSLMMMHSLPYLKKKNYSHLFFERNEKEKDLLEELKKDFLHLQGIPLDCLHNPHAIKSIMDIFIQHQARAEKISTVFPDWPDKRNEADMNEIHIYGASDTRKTNRDLEKIYRTTIKELCRESAFFFFKKVNADTAENVLKALSHASCGPKTFDNFQKTSSLPSEAKEKILLAGTNIRKLYQSKIEKSKNIFQLPVRNECIARNIADIHGKNPKTKKISYNGFSHVDDGTARNQPSAYSVLPEILENEYNIKTTNVVFVEKKNIQHIKSVFSRQKLDPSFICLEELLPQIDARFEANAAEAYYALAKEEPTEGLHNVKDLNIGRIDYAIVMPLIDTLDVVMDVFKKAYLLNM